MKKVAILGSTGSIGTQTLEVIRNQKDLKVVALSAGKNISLLEEQAREFRPIMISVTEKEDALRHPLFLRLLVCSGLSYARRALFHLLFLFSDHTTNHLAADASGFLRGQITIVTFL